MPALPPLLMLPLPPLPALPPLLVLPPLLPLPPLLVLPQLPSPVLLTVRWVISTLR